MRVVFFLVLLVGIGMAGFGIYMLNEKFNKDQAELKRLRAAYASRVEFSPVVVATEELKYGQALRPEHIKIVEWPKGAQPENVFRTLEDILGPEGSRPRAILRTIEPGEAVLTTKVTNFGQDAGVSSRLSAGMRAFTIRVDVASGVSGFLQPGDHVDILWSGNDNGQTITRLILEKIKLIAIDQIADEDTNRPIVARTVTVEVAPIIVASLAQAQATGKLSLSLRGAEDDTSTGPLNVDTSDLLGTVETVVQQERVCTIKVRKGAEVVEIPAECPPE